MIAMSKDLLNAYYDALRSGDEDTLRGMLTEDIEVNYFGPPGLLPWVGRHKGFEAYRIFLERVRNNLDIVEVVQDCVVTEGEWVVVMGRGRWHAKSTGRRIEANMTNAFRFRDGKVAEYRVYTDTAAFAYALGRATIAGGSR